MNHEKTKPLQMTEYLLRTPIGQSFFLQVTDAADSAQVMRSLHSRIALLSSHAIQIRTKSVRCLVDADKNVEGDEDHVIRLVMVMVINREAKG